MGLSGYRSRFKIMSLDDVEKMRASGYRYVLMDTCFIIDEADSLPLLCDPEFIKGSRRLPAVTDFTHNEFRSVASGKMGEVKTWTRTKNVGLYICSAAEAWRKYVRLIASGGVVVEVITDASSRRGVEQLVNMLERDIRRAVIKHYAGERGRGNPYDMALAATTLLLVSSGIPSGIATRDNNLFQLASRFGEMGYDVEAWKRPWRDRV